MPSGPAWRLASGNATPDKSLSPTNAIIDDVSGCYYNNTMSRVIPLGPRVPRRGNRFSAWLGRLLLALAGWRVVGDFPDVPRAVVIVAPHTSNWDGYVALAAIWALRLDLRFMGKHTLFRPPLGALLRWFGGIPIDRSSSAGVVEQSVNRFRERDQLLLGITPEGTRKGAGSWKSGFHRIARQAGVPIIVAGFDFARRHVVIADCVEPGDHPEADMARILENFRHIEPCRPERLSAPLRELRRGNGLDRNGEIRRDLLD